jgi:predicted lysophospholipase L1 biosynthesis ABC-type transport system permease subunit
MTPSQLYRAALFLYPPAFRREFSREMARDFEEATDETGRAGRRHLLSLWGRIGADLARTVVIQWLRTGLPILLLCSTLGAVVAASVAANVLPRQPFTVPATAHDRDVMTLILLTIVVLLVVVATILFTFWFSRPMFRRHRR